jgi:NADH-quinone oxidoreductase subunit I
LARLPILPLFKGLKETVKKFFSQPATVEYPEAVRDIPENYRGRIVTYLDLCVGCTACSNVCPNATCQMEPLDYDAPMNKRSIFPRIDVLQCMYCGLCEEACPTDAIRLESDFELSDYDREIFDYDAYEISKSEGQLMLENPEKRNPERAGLES